MLKVAVLTLGFVFVAKFYNKVLVNIFTFYVAFFLLSTGKKNDLLFQQGSRLHTFEKALILQCVVGAAGC